MAVERVAEALDAHALDPDEHALLSAAYKDPRLPLGLRIETAKAAADENAH